MNPATAAAPPAVLILGRLATAPVGAAPWEILAGPDIPADRVRAAWEAITRDPHPKYAEICRYDLHCPHARVYGPANPALADAAEYLAEISRQIPAARARAAETRGAFVQAERDKMDAPADPEAQKAKRLADHRASEAAKSLRRLEDELARRHRVVAGQAPPDRTLDGTDTLLAPVPDPEPEPDAPEPEPAAPEPAAKKKAAKKKAAKKKTPK